MIQFTKPLSIHIAAAMIEQGYLNNGVKQDVRAIAMEDGSGFNFIYTLTDGSKWFVNFRTGEAKRTDAEKPKLSKLAMYDIVRQIEGLRLGYLAHVRNQCVIIRHEGSEIASITQDMHVICFHKETLEAIDNILNHFK